MQWSEKYSLGIKEIDKQHQQLVAIINNFQEKFINKKEKSTLMIEDLMGKTLQFLVNYSKYHFEMEEEFMRSIGYPNLSYHKELHQGLIKELKEVLLKLKNTDSYKPVQFYYFLTKWLTDHICDADKEIAIFYSEQIEPNETENNIAQKAEDIVAFFEPKFFKLQSLLHNNLISESDLRDKQIQYIVSFYKKNKIRKIENLYIIFDSINILKKKINLDKDELDQIYTGLKNLVETDIILNKVEDHEEKLKIIKLLSDEKLITEEEYNSYKSKILDELE